MENIIKWLENGSNAINIRLYGSSFGSGFGSGDGSGFGSGDGSGDGSGFGSGDGSGFGSGDGSGDGSGFGGDGSGKGSGSRIKTFRNKEVYPIDGVPTIINHVKDFFAIGYILNGDFTLTPCKVIKGNGYFAHGKTLREARNALWAKIFENMDSDEAIGAFLGKFKRGKKYPGKDFFEWHHYLTGSCLMGREAFVKNHGFDLEALYSVDEFIAACENDYGGKIIKQLKEKWNEI